MEGDNLTITALRALGFYWKLFSGPL